tara:strand:- start:34989 stop:35687 length:699 start_codon:yes stop_codon:yes gene_type:complete
MPLWGNSDNNSLTPPGVGGGISQEQMSLFANAANQSGLTDMARAQVDQMTSGLRNEDQVQLLYHLMAVQPNEVSLFFLEYPDFLKELSALIGLIIRKELYAWFASGVLPTTVNPEKAASSGYSTITDENIDAQIAKVAPIQDMQQKMHQADNQAMHMMNGHQQQQMMGQMQQQQWQQQQMMQQQMMAGQMPPQRPGFGSALGNFGSSLIRGSLGLPPAQTQAPMYNGYPPQQ